MSVRHILSSPVADFTGTVTVFNSAGVTVTANATEIVRPSDWNSAHNQFLTLSGNTAGASTLSGSNLVFQGGNGIVLSATDQTIVISASDQSVQTQNMVSLQGSTGAVVFANSNGLTFGGNANTITASHNGLTTARASNDAVGLNTALTANGVAWTVNSSGLSLNVPAFLTTAALSNHSHGNPTLALTNLSGTTASASDGFTLSLAAASPIAGIAMGAGTQTGTSGTIEFANSNGITFGMSGSSQITAIHDGLTTQSGQAFSADASSAFQTLVFQDSNGLSFSNNAGSLRMTHALQFTSATSAITSNALHSSASRVINVVAATDNAGGGAASLSGNVSFSNANGLSFYTSAGGAIVASHNALTTARASNDAIGLNTALTANGVSVTANSSGLSLNFPAFLTTQSGQAFSADASSIFQTLSFQDSNGISFSNNAGALRITHGLQFTSATSAITSNALNTSASRVINLVAATNNTGGGTASLSSNVSFSNVNGATFYTSAGGAIALSYSVPTQTNLAFSADASSTFQTLTLQNSNGISFSNNAGAVRITHDLQFTSATSAITSNALNTSASRVINIVAATNNTGGGTASLSSNVSFSNANGLSFYTSAGGAVVGSVVTSYRASNDAIGLNTAQSNVTWTANSGGLSLNAAGYAGTTTAITGNAVITLNSLGLRFDGVGLAGTTTAVSGGAAITLNSSGLRFDGNSLAGTSSGFTGANISGSMTHNTAGLALSLSVAAPGAAAENNWVNLLGANTAGNTTASGSTIGYSGVNITLSGTNGSQIVISGPGTSSISATGAVSVSANGNTISVGAGPMSAYAVANTTLSTSAGVDMRSLSFAGSGGVSVGISNGSVVVSGDNFLLSRWYASPEGASSAGSAMTQGSMSFQRVFVPEELTLTRVDIPILISLASSAANNTGNLLISSGLVIYSVSATSTLNPIVGAFGTTTYTHASNTANFNSITGPRYASFPIATLLAPGEYYIGVQLSTNNNSSIGTATTQLAATISLQHGAIYTASNYQEFGAVSATSVNLRPFVGVGASVTATNQTVNINAITQTGTALMRANIGVNFRNF